MPPNVETEPQLQTYADTFLPTRISRFSYAAPRLGYIAATWHASDAFTLEAVQRWTVDEVGVNAFDPIYMLQKPGPTWNDSYLCAPLGRGPATILRPGHYPKPTGEADNASEGTDSTT